MILWTQRDDTTSTSLRAIEILRIFAKSQAAEPTGRAGCGVSSVEVLKKKIGTMLGLFPL